MPAHIPTHRAASPEALEAARYVTEMAAQLEAIASKAGLDLLAYFVGMAREEGDLLIRGNARLDRSAADLEPLS